MERLAVFFVLALSVALAGCAGVDAGSKTVYSDDGRSELTVPGSWSARADFGKSATIRVADRDNFLVVNTYLPDEVRPMSLADFARRLSDGLKDNLANGRVTTGEILTVNGRPAHRHVIHGAIDGTELTYVSTLIEGKDGVRHHVLGWTTGGAYTGGAHVIDRVSASFRESPSRRAERKRVDLTFNWPKNLEATVSHHEKTVKRSESSEISGRYRTAVRVGANGDLIVSSRILKLDFNSSGDKGKLDYLQKVLKEASAEVPDYIVTRDGEFVRVVNLGAFRDRLERALVANLPANAKANKERLLGMLRSMLSEEVLAAAMMDEWNKSVGGWAGGSYVPGDVYRFDEQFYSPSLGKATFPMSVSQQLAGFAPCTDRQRARRCVRLIYTARVSDPAFAAAMQRFLRTTLKQPLDVTDAEVLKRTEVIAEPQTLLPHRVESSKTTRLVLRMDGKSHTGTETEESTEVYAYTRK